ncbi:aminotransferase-like domain-containing protein [Rhodopirellula sp. P2]|uniref:aminotransferase-like domain-containing protein n=1 Tax=Rhodopirellula sp. P2 TaxID=2127060 RepID=UPI002367FCB6|nr:PLP-dependent aminotransferase family protein [Rhodopirellula sp. P2]WDQ15690.1 PLP-dependent aminotransferase family protein [Rhodopirellula sp. P2]
MRRSDWTPDLTCCKVPLFEGIARAIADDIADGKLVAGDHLPTQRALAKQMNLDVTTVARGYAEAARIGLIEARVGSGTFVRAALLPDSLATRRADLADRSMNQPPDITDAVLLGQMRASMTSVGEMLPQLLRYQPSGGVSQDKAAATAWLSRRGVLLDHHSLHVTAGAHTAISAVLSTLLTHGGSIACESITYPGLRGIAQTIGTSLHGLATDQHGIDPAALDEAASRKNVRVLYQNPTLRNPTTETVPLNRRVEIVEVARRHGIAIVEDDAYGFLPVNAPPAIAMLAPELTFYVASLAKCLGPGLRIAYLLTPHAMEPRDFAASLRAVSVMASPLTTALVTRWIESGLADAILAAVRSETRARRKVLSHCLPKEILVAAENGFHAWIQLPKSQPRARVIDWMRGYALGAVASDEFCFGIEPPEALRLCLGGAATREEATQAIESLSDLIGA